MSIEFAAVAILSLTLVLVVVVDRGVPNTLECIAFGVEEACRRTVAALRRTAARLRERHRRIELENQERLSGHAVETRANSRSFSAAA